MNTKRIFLCALMMLGFVGTVTISSMATAQTNMTWCTTWESRYVDAGFGEDIYYSNNKLWRPAGYGLARVLGRNSPNDPWTNIWQGILNSSGCTPSLPVQYNYYRFGQGTYVQRDTTREVWINVPEAAWGGNFIWLNSNITVSGLGPGNHTHTFQPNWTSPYGNVMPILGRLLSMRTTLDYRANTQTYIRVSHAECTDAWYEPGSPGGKGLCVSENAQSLGNDVYGHDITAWKFSVAHEIGHRVAYAANGLKNRGSYGWSGTPWQCGCSFVNPNMDDHCLTSRNTIGVSQGEGFAYFYSAAMFNDREYMDGVFVYPKEALMVPSPDSSPHGVSYISYPITPFKSYVVNKEEDTNYFDRWMKRRCPPPVGDQNKGVELDWTRYIYDVFSVSTPYRINITQLQDIWAASSSPNWNIVKSVAQQTLTTDQFLLFDVLAYKAGIAYYTN